MSDYFKVNSKTINPTPTKINKETKESKDSIIKQSQSKHNSNTTESKVDNRMNTKVNSESNSNN